MKKMLVTSAALALAAMAVSAADVYSSNTVGYTKLNMSPGFQMVSSAFVTVGGTDTVNIQALFDADGLVAGQTIGTSDQIQIWNGTAFDVYFYRAYKATNPNQFLLGPAWVKSTAPTTVSALEVKASTGFWFSRPLAASAGLVTAPGQVNAAATSTLQMQAGFNMAGSAYPVTFPLNGVDCPFDWTTATAGFTIGTSDQIQIWNGTAFDVYFYRAYKATNPNQFLLGPAWVKSTAPTVVSLDTVPPGAGFWYVKTGSAANIVQDSPLVP